MDYGKMAIELHAQHRGKIGIYSKIPLKTMLDMSLAYTPGVADVCMEIAHKPERTWELTNRANMVAVGSRPVGWRVGVACVEAFLAAEFEAGRHVARIEKISALENER